MYDVQVLVDKITGFQTSKEIAEIMSVHEIKGNLNSVYSCAISNFFKLLGDGVVSIATSSNDTSVCLKDGTYVQFSNTEAMVDFIYEFDHCFYPDLVNEVESFQNY